MRLKEKNQTTKQFGPLTPPVNGQNTTSESRTTQTCSISQISTALVQTSSAPTTMTPTNPVQTQMNPVQTIMTQKNPVQTIMTQMNIAQTSSARTSPTQTHQASTTQTRRRCKKTRSHITCHQKKLPQQLMPLQLLCHQHYHQKKL